MYLNRADVSKAAMGRLPKYLGFLRGIDAAENPNISSAAIARGLGLGEVQVRKDLCAVSGAGKPKIGYATKELISSIENFLGYSDPERAVIIGAGKLGTAILDYGGFSEYGLEIGAAFDIKVCEKVLSAGGKPIFPLRELGAYCASSKVKIVILTVPDSAAQAVCDTALSCGIKAIWSFAASKLSVPEGVAVRYENIALSLAHLSKQIRNV